MRKGGAPRGRLPRYRRLREALEPAFAELA